MSTADLVRTCLDYPVFASTIITANNFQDGYDALVRVSNAFQELSQRQDAGIEILDMYKSVSIDDIKKYDAKPLTRKICIDMLTSQEIFIKQLTAAEKKDLVRAALENLEEINRDGGEHFRL